jgi:hypothetical protein
MHSGHGQCMPVHGPWHCECHCRTVAAAESNVEGPAAIIVRGDEDAVLAAGVGVDDIAILQSPGAHQTRRLHVVIFVPEPQEVASLQT